MMKYYCQLCGEAFPYELRRIPVEFPDGGIRMLLACELCAEEYEQRFDNGATMEFTSADKQDGVGDRKGVCILIDELESEE